MSCTEDKALTKWCPHVRYSSIRGNAINRWAADEDSNHNPRVARCIASECMAWRSDDKVTGYCGLAGWS